MRALRPDNKGPTQRLDYVRQRKSMKQITQHNTIPPRLSFLCFALRWWCFSSLLVAGLFFFAPTVRARTPLELQKSFEQVQAAQRLGPKQIVESIKRYEKIFYLVFPQLSEPQRDHSLLMLHKLNVMRYLNEGKSPSFDKLGSLSREEIPALIDRYKSSIIKQKKALEALRKYNELLQKSYKRINGASTQYVELRRYVDLRFSQNSEHHITNRIRAMQQAVISLRLELKLTANSQQQQQNTEKTRKHLINLSNENASIRKEQREISLRAKKSYRIFKNERKALLQRANHARTFFILGGILTALGIGLASTGGIFLHDIDSKNPYKDYFCDSMPTTTSEEETAKIRCEAERALPNPIISPPRSSNGQRSLKEFYGWGGPTFIASGLVIAGTGIAFLIAGAVFVPPKKAYYEAVLRSQSPFLEPRPTETSSNCLSTDARGLRSCPVLFGTFQ
jgi:hypothetical protein